MRYYTHQTFDNIKSYIITQSEEDIRKDYYPYWYGNMCDKFGKECVDTNYTFEDCLDDYKIVTFAQEAKINENLYRHRV